MMTREETELSKKLMNAQMLAMQAVELIEIQDRQIESMQTRLDKLEAFAEALAIGKGGARENGH